MIVTVTLLGVSSLVLFVLMIIFLGKYRGMEQQLDAFNREQADYITAGERNSADVSRLLDAARKERQSLVRYMIDSQQSVMQRVTGAKGDDAEALGTKLESIQGADTVSLIQLVRNLQGQIGNLERDLSQAQAAQAAAQRDRDTEASRVAQIEQDYTQQISSLQAQLKQYATDVESYRQGTDSARAAFLKQIDDVVQERREVEADLSGQLDALRDKMLVLQDQLRLARQERKSETLLPPDEFSLVDGSVIDTDLANGLVTINRGRQQKLVLGMSFSVYSDRTGIRPNEDGTYPRGKSAIEVINIGPTSATCRVLFETQGNPIVRGDVIANPVYDPNKVYKMLVYGNFDANGDGRATPGEKADVEATIARWGGTVIDEMAGDVDFVVLGQKPPLPPKPSLNAPVEVILEWQRLDEIANTYDRLLEQAQATSIPVLNENRLYSLTGRSMGPNS